MTLVAPPTTRAAAPRQSRAVSVTVDLGPPGRRADRHVHRLGLATTPARMRLAQLVVTAVLSFAGLAVTVDATADQAAVANAERSAELVVATQSLRAGLARADGAAVNAFLAGGAEREEDRAAYWGALDDAAAALADAGRSVDDPEARSVVDEIQRQLPEYSSLVAQARANDRQQLPLGAAYLRRGSELIRTDTEEALDDLWSAGDARYRTETEGLLTSWSTLLPLLVLANALAVLLGVQIWLAGRTRRTLNAGLLAASVIGAATAGFVTVAGLGAGARTVDATQAYDRLAALSAVRADAYDQRAASILALVVRSGRDEFNARAATSARNVDARIEASGDDADLMEPWREYLESSEEITELDLAGQYGPARDGAAEASDRFLVLDDAISVRTYSSTNDLTRSLDGAGTRLRLVQLIGLPLGLAAGLVAAWGLQQRIADYH